MPERTTAFISYSHAADGKLAPSLQRGLRGFAKPWYRLNALRVFRDQTSLSATPALWSGIERALARSRFFILLASPEATASPWVDKEVSYWLEHKPRDNLLIALTEGEIAWDDSTGHVDRERTTALPFSLDTAFASEPFWIDLRFARAQSDVSLRQPDFRNAVADLAAPIHGRDKDTLLGDDISQHRRAMRLARAAVATLVALLVAASVAAFLALQQGNAALVGQSKALAGQAVASIDSDPAAGLRLAVQAAKARPTIEAEGALRAAVAADPLRATLRGHTGFVSGAVFSPDGKLVVTAGGVGTARLWDVASGRSLQITLSGNGNIVNSAVFSPDGKLVLTAGGDKTARIWATCDVCGVPLDELLDRARRRLASSG